jgi:hypothetical protein
VSSSNASFIVKALALAGLLSGCPAAQSFTTARTLPPGEIQHTVAVEWLGVDYQNSECETMPESCFDPVGYPAIPWPAYLVRYGANDFLELGGKLSTAGLITAEFKFQLLRSEYFDFALDPNVSFTPGTAVVGIREGGIDAAFTYLSLPILMSVNLGDFTATFAPRFSYLLLFSSSRSIVDGLFGGGGVSVEYRVSDVVSIVAGFDYQLLVLSAAAASANFFSAGLGISFGAQPDYSTPEEAPPAIDGAQSTE